MDTITAAIITYLTPGIAEAGKSVVTDAYEGLKNLLKEDVWPPE